MNTIPILASAPHRAGLPGTSVEMVEVSCRRYSLATLRNMIATFRARRRFRCDLEQLSKNPHLIEDIGLTGQQTRVEITKHFWQA